VTVAATFPEPTVTYASVGRGPEKMQLTRLKVPVEEGARKRSFEFPLKMQFVTVMAELKT
jgi:hypothetical protein